MRRPGQEFGSEKPSVIYVALRWNDPSPMNDSVDLITSRARTALSD